MYFYMNIHAGDKEQTHITKTKAQRILDTNYRELYFLGDDDFRDASIRHIERYLNVANKAHGPLMHAGFTALSQWPELKMRRMRLTAVEEALLSTTGDIAPEAPLDQVSMDEVL